MLALNPLIEEMAAGAILDLDDPDVGIEADLARQALLDLGLGDRLRRRDMRLNARSVGCASSKAVCGAGPNSSAVPSSRLSLMKIAPASSAPRRRTAAKAPSTWQRRI